MYRCPHCCSTQAIFVQITITADVPLRRDGTVDILSRRGEYTDESEAWCGACPYQGTVADFYVSENELDQECMRMGDDEWQQFARRMGLTEDGATPDEIGGSAK